MEEDSSDVVVLSLGLIQVTVETVDPIQVSQEQQELVFPCATALSVLKSLH